MLKLVVNNTKKEESNQITCRSSCDLFDEITQTCSINHHINIDSPYEAARCGFFLSKEAMFLSTEENKIRFSLIEEEAEYLLDNKEIFQHLIGVGTKKDNYSYPAFPDFNSLRDDAHWYISRCKSYGCWIVNFCEKPLKCLSNISEAEKGWSQKVYKSPIPLHDHKSSISIASKVVWVIDKDGYGQYGLLVNGRITSISSPKPEEWKNRY